MTKAFVKGENRWLKQSHRSLWLWSIGFGAKAFQILMFFKVEF